MTADSTVPTAPPVTEAPSTTTAATTTEPAATDAPTTTVSMPSLDPRLVVEPLGDLGPNCSESGCTTVAFAPSGEPVVFDAALSSLVFLDSGRSVPVDPALGSWLYLVAVGPDDVAYIAGSPPDAMDPVMFLVAIATTGPAAGQVVARSPDELDGSGDSSLIASARGIVSVGCCGFDDRLPPVDNRLAMAWVTPTGEPSGVVLPEVFLEYPASRTETIVVRAEGDTEQRWTVPALLAGRDMPPVVATDDGGALVWMYDPIGDPDTPAVLYDLRPDGTIDTYQLGDLRYVAAMHPSRVLIAYTGSGADDPYVRLTLP